MQVDPMRCILKPPGIELLEPKCDLLLSNSAFKICFQIYFAPVHRGGGHRGRAVQVDSINIRVESDHGFSACAYNMTTAFNVCFHVSTCAAKSWRTRTR